MRYSKMGLRTVLLATSLLAGAPVLAQTAPATEQPLPGAAVQDPTQPLPVPPTPGAQVDPQIDNPTSVAEPDAAGDQTDIVVTGTRASLGRALDIKRATIGIVDSISAEDIGKFPDRNVAESLQRVPGVSIDRQAGEGRFITVRGFGPQFNTVLLNGRLLATDNAGREFSFDILPSELISGADVYKSSAANFQEGGIGSTVVVKTARPTDRAGLRVAGQIGGKYDSGSKDVTPTGSFLISQSNEDRTFGILASFVYDKRNAVLKRFSSDGWLTGQNLDYNRDGRTDLANVAVLRSYNQVVDTNSRERIGGTLAIDYQIADNLKLQLDGLYTQYKIDSRINTLAYFSDPGDIIAATINNNRTVTQFTRGNTGNLATDQVVSGAPRDARTFALGGNLKYDADENDSATLDVSYSQATNDGGGQTPFYVLGSRNTGLNPTFDLRPGEPTPIVGGVISPTDTSRLRAHFGLQSGQDVKDEVGQVRLDATHDFGSENFLQKVNYGALVSRRVKTIDDLSTPQGILCFYCGYFATVPTGITSTFNSGGFLGSPGLPRQWLNFDTNALLAYYNTDAAIRQKGDPTEEATFRALIGANGGTYRGVFNPAASGKVTETSVAYYAQTALGGEIGTLPWTGSAGVRWVYTRVRSQGAAQQISSITQLPGDATQLNFTLTPPITVDQTNDYNYFLPSATFKLDITDKLALRLAGSRTLTRPTLTQLAPTQGFTIRPPATFLSNGGNPALKPYLAWNLDAGVDFYVNRASYFSVAGFYKWIDNFIVNVTAPRQILGFTFQDTRPTNQRSSKVYGVEFTAQYTFDFLPSPLDGFGATANYTLVKSSTSFDPSVTTQIFNVEGLSDSANAVLFYEKGPVQVRGAYNWRAGFLRTTFGTQGEPESVNAYGQYDASASLKVLSNVSVFVEGQNLTNRKLRAFQRFNERILSLEDSGRRITAGVRASF